MTGLLLLSACGGPSPGAANSPAASPSPSKEALITSVEACQLVTATDASTAAGTTVVSSSASSGISIPGSCLYASSDGASTVFVYAQTYPDTSTAEAVSADQVAAALSGQYGISNAKSVTGIGDKAFEYTATSSDGTGVAIFVFKANVVLMILLSHEQSGGSRPHGGQPVVVSTDRLLQAWAVMDRRPRWQTAFD